MSTLIAWIIRAIPFGTIIMFGSMGETITEKSGNLNLGVPAVSYTHLDVYKRQLYICLYAGAFASQTNKEGCRMNLAVYAATPLYTS